MQKILLFGAGVHASVIIDILEESNKYKIVGLLDSLGKKGSDFMGYQLLGKPEDIFSISREHKVKSGLVCVGDNYSRFTIVEEIQKVISDFNFINAIHPSVIISKRVQIGYGNVIMPNVVVNCNCMITNHCIINTNSTLEHDTRMDDFSSLAPGVSMGGNVSIGKYSAVGIGANLLNKVNIGMHVVIGAGALVTKHVGDYCLSYGVPAQVIRKRKAGEKYLK